MTGWWAAITMIIAFALIALLPLCIVIGLHADHHPAVHSTTSTGGH